MKTSLRKTIRQLLLLAGTSAVAANAFAYVGPQNPPPGPGMIPDFFGVVPNFANSPQPILAKVQITDAGGGTGAIAAATTYDYTNSARTGAVMNVELVSGGTAYSAATTVTVTGGSGSTPVSLTPIIVNGVIIGFNEISNPLPFGWTGLGSGYTAPIAGSGLRKFVDSVPLFNQANNLGQQLPVAVPDTTTFPGSDYYEIAASTYIQQLHSDLPPTHLRGYKQLNAPAGSAALNNNYLGPIIVAQSNRPVRVKFVNQMPTGAAGTLPLPVDHSYMGTAGAADTDNRTALHMHGGNTPWISDGTPRQWVKPKGEAGPNKGVSASNVPDMWFDANGNVLAGCAGQLTCAVAGASNNPGDGALTFYFTNQQSQRLMFYHDHTEGTTRLNVYDGMAGAYVLQDPTELAMTNGGTANGATYTQVLPTDIIPLIIQEKTFVPDNTTPVLNFYGPFASQLNSNDPTWRWGSGTAAPGLNGTGDLWLPHVYMTNQNPGDISGANALGRWDYGPWFWPPFTGLINQPINNPYYDPACASSATVVCEPQQIPGIPNGNTLVANALSNPTGTPEAFNDTPLVNGTAYPYTAVEPKKYRLRILSVGNDRALNLSMVVAASKNSLDTTAFGNAGAVSNSILCDGTTAVNQADCTEIKMVPFSSSQNIAKPFPANWYTFQKGGISFDDRTGGVFDPTTRGPAMVQIGTEGGFLSTPSVIANQPVNYEYNPKNIVIGNVKQHALLLGPAERADVVVDFSKFAGSTIILYNDSPAPMPAWDLRYDYFTGNPDNTDTGGAFSSIPGYGPNTRTIMQFRVASACTSANCGTGINLAPAVTAKTSQDFVDPAYLATLTTSVQTAFRVSQDPVIVPQAAYNPVYGTSVVDSLGSDVSHIADTQLNVTPFLSTAGFPAAMEPGPIILNLAPKSIIEDFTVDYGRMNALLGVEVPRTTATTQTSIPQGFIDPPTELVKISPNDGSPVTGVMADGTQLWKITHNGVDSHAVHFHLFNVQIVNRVGWDGAVRMPDANELGWKDTVRMNPLEDVVVALRPKTMSLPFKVPNSHRLLDPSNAGTAAFYNVDPTSGGTSNVTNVSTNFGWEYIWHCHILGHEENDMMRSIAVAQQPDAPSGLTQLANANGSTTLNWTDNSVIANWATIQRDTVSTFNSAKLTTFNTAVVECANQSGCPATYTDTTGLANTAYYYRVVSNNTVGGGDNYARLPAALAGTLTPGFTGYDNVTASSNWSNTANPPVGVATLTPVSLAFGNQKIGVASAGQTVTLSNTGNATLAVSGLALTAGSNFSYTNGCPATLAPNATCTISVTFKPTAYGALGDTLTVTDNSQGVPGSKQTIALTGSGIAPVATVTPASAAFGSINMGATSAAQTVTVTNTGTDTLSIAGVALTTGTNYTVTNSCPATLAPLANCTISVSFKPTATGALTDTLTITDNSLAVANSKQTVSLSGTGLGAPVAAVTPVALTFSNQALNVASAAQTVTIRNSGTAALTISSIATAAPFARPTGTAGGTCATTLAAAASCTVNVTFTPTAGGSYSGKLTITDNSGNVAGSTQIVTLTGTTVPAATITGNGAFGSLAIGNVSAVSTFTVTNTGPASMTLAIGSVTFSGTNANQFTQSNLCEGVTLAVGATCKITASFVPTATGAKTASINVALPGGGATATLALSATAVAASYADTVTPAGPLTFATTTRGTISAGQAITVTNTGNAPLTLTAAPITLTGTNANQFTVNASTCTANKILAVGATCVANVVFSPTTAVAVGAKTATLNVLSNATAKTVTLNGTSN